MRPALLFCVLLLEVPFTACALAAADQPNPASGDGGTMSQSQKPATPATDERLSKLTPLQFEVTQRSGTERPYQNAYWDNHEAGVYVDIVSGEPLFSSLDKFESGTGWPSFTRPLVTANLKEKRDVSLFMVRTEVRSAKANSHLGHLFDDGPAPTGMRYCMNSASMRFVPVKDLVAEGLGEFLPLFEKSGAQHK